MSPRPRGCSRLGSRRGCNTASRRGAVRLPGVACRRQREACHPGARPRRSVTASRPHRWSYRGWSGWSLSSTPTATPSRIAACHTRVRSRRRSSIDRRSNARHAPRRHPTRRHGRSQGHPARPRPLPPSSTPLVALRERRSPPSCSAGLRLRTGRAQQARARHGPRHGARAPAAREQTAQSAGMDRHSEARYV